MDTNLFKKEERAVKVFLEIKAINNGITSLQDQRAELNNTLYKLTGKYYAEFIDWEENILCLILPDKK